MKYKYTNNLGVPEIFASALLHRERRSFIKGSFASASQLSGPAYSWALYKTLSQQGHEIEVDVSGMWAAALGTAAHRYLENALQDNSNIVQRTTFQSIYDGQYLVTGEPDLFDVSTGKLYDLKTTSVNKPLDDDSIKSWEYQVNIYASLLRHNDYSPESAAIIVAYKDWSKKRALNSQSYPQSPIAELKINLWSAEQAQDWIINRCKEFEAAFSSMSYGNIQECSPKDRWEKPASYAAKKTGNKKASKKLDSEAAALKWIQAQKKPSDYEIEHRPSERTRCKYYCDIASACPNWQRVKQDESDSED